MTKKRILIIDDDFQVALFLRAALEVISPHCQIVSVPSAEEGLLEMNETVDLLIADLKLPGMNGVDFVKKVRHNSPSLPIIVITGEVRPKWHDEARSVGLAGFFRKPIEMGTFTRIARMALGEEPIEETEPLASSTEPANPQIKRRLNALRIDSGARYVMLVENQGRRLESDGKLIELDANLVASKLVGELTTSYELARVLNAPQPYNIHYQAGASYDLYIANVGKMHLIAFFFDAQRYPGHLKEVWGHTCRSIGDLLPMLGKAREDCQSSNDGEEEMTTNEKEEAITEKTADFSVSANFKRLPSAKDIEEFWSKVLNESPSGAGFKGLDLDQARAKGLIPTEFDND